MKEVNAAYAAGDEDASRRILADLENSPDAVQGSGIGADLVRILRQLRQVRNRIEALDREISILLSSDISKLKAKAEAASADGRDLLEEMATSIKVRVEAVRRTVHGAS